MGRNLLYQSDEAKELVDQYVNDGIGYPELARKTGYPKSAVRKVLLAYGVLRGRGSNTRHTEYRFPEEVRRSIAEEYVTTDIPLLELARRHSCSETSIHNMAVEFYGPNFKDKMPKKNRGKVNSSKRNSAMAISLFENGAEVEEIAGQLGLTQETVRRYLRKAGHGTTHCEICNSIVPLKRLNYCSDACASVSVKDRWLKNKFGITRSFYRNLLEVQGGGCAICGDTRDLVVDHDHKTGEVRGVLCRSCNSGIALLKENARILKRAIGYLS